MAVSYRARPTRPPAGIASGPTLLYAVVPPSVSFVNRGRFIVDGKTFPGAPRVLVVHDMIQHDYDLLFCDDSWNILAGTSRATLEEVKAEAERFYPGLTPHWVDLEIDDARPMSTCSASVADLRVPSAAAFPASTRTHTCLRFGVYESAAIASPSSGGSYRKMVRDDAGAAEQGDEADEAGASDGASQLLPGVMPTPVKAPNQTHVRQRLTC